MSFDTLIQLGKRQARQCIKKTASHILLLELKDMISQLNTTIKMLNNTIISQQTKNENLKAELSWFRQKLFGSSSEKRAGDISGQLSLFDETAEEEKPVELINSEIV